MMPPGSVNVSDLEKYDGRQDPDGHDGTMILIDIPGSDHEVVGDPASDKKHGSIEIPQQHNRRVRILLEKTSKDMTHTEWHIRPPSEYVSIPCCSPRTFG
jgi:hypothetical protein